jgi:ubiquinone/menaquinone biosynthesis C-methylase UbiE
MLGKYPGLTIDKTAYKGGKILDMGFGDGRNWPLLKNIGLQISGVEISKEIITLGYKRAEKLGVSVDLRQGRNSDIPFEGNCFDYILACHSCYYVDKNTIFEDNVLEYARVLKPGGFLIASLAESNASIFDNSEPDSNGCAIIRSDPWNLRNGYVFRCFKDEEDVKRDFKGYFDNFSTGLIQDNYFGIRINLFLLVCRKKKD